MSEVAGSSGTGHNEKIEDRKDAIYQAMWNQIGNHRIAKLYLKCPTHVKEELLSYINEKKNQKENYDRLPYFDDFDNVMEIEDQGDEEKDKRKWH